MEVINFLKEKLQRIQNNFNNAEIKLGYSECGETYIVEINPLSVYNSNDYIDMEISISDSFSVEFPEEDLFFVSEESLNKVANPIFCLESKTNIKHIIDFNSYSFSFDQEYNSLINSKADYILASAA